MVMVLTILSCDSINQNRFDSEKLINKPPLDRFSFAPMKGDTLRFALPLSGVYTTFQSYAQGEESYWICLVFEDFRLDFYSLDQKKAIRSVQFESEGPNGIEGNVDGFYYHNADTIFMLSSDANRIYLMNDQGVRMDMFDFNNVPLPDGFEEYIVYANNGLQNGPYYVSSEKTLQFYTLKWYDDLEDYVNHEALASYSIVDRKFVSIYGNFPNNYKRGANFSIHDEPTLTVVDTLSFVQFGASEYLAAYNNVSGELLYVSNEYCNHWPGPLEPIPINSNGQRVNDWLVEQPSFPILLHDELNEVLYRFLKHKQPILDGNGELNRRWFGTWCISIYDYGLQRLGHHKLPENDALFPIFAFAGAGEVWIRNLSRPLDENSIMFFRFKPIINEVVQ